MGRLLLWLFRCFVDSFLTPSLTPNPSPEGRGEQSVGCGERFALFLGLLLLPTFLFAQAFDPPRVALKHRSELTRIAHAEWGLNAPVAAFAAQIHQESGWNPNAVSRVGAKGMAQFMPATARWWCDFNKLSVDECQPSNPTWAMRGLVGYDKWLFARVHGGSDYDKFWAALRSYNGGLGHWQAEAKIALAGAQKDGSKTRPYDGASRADADKNTLEDARAAIDAACGRARRHVSHCAENLGYPRRILVEIMPRYASFGGLLLEDNNEVKNTIENIVKNKVKGFSLTPNPSPEGRGELIEGRNDRAPIGKFEGEAL